MRANLSRQLFILLRKLIIGKQQSTVALRNFLDFFLLLQRETRLDVTLLSVDDLVSQTLSNCLVGLYRTLPGTGTDQVNGLVHSPQGRHVHGLLPHHTASSNSGRVLARASLQNCTHKHLQRVSACEQVDNFEGMSDDTDGLDFLTSVASMELH